MKMLHEFLTANRDAIIGRAREKGAARPAPQAPEEELASDLPLFFDQLIAVLRLASASSNAICLDEAIAEAVTEYGHQRERCVTDDESARRGVFAELRDSLHSATLSLQLIESGDVGPSGSTAAILDRSLKRMAELVESSIAHSEKSRLARNTHDDLS